MKRLVAASYVTPSQRSNLMMRTIFDRVGLEIASHASEPFAFDIPQTNITLRESSCQERVVRG
jgi:hypothetical protein